jgi:hypothetical protein
MKGLLHMKTMTRFDVFVSDMKHYGRACMRTLRSTARRMAAMPWPVLLLTAILLSLVLTIVPLAIMLFVAFLLLKFVAGIFFDRRPRQIGQ